MDKAERLERFLAWVGRDAATAVPRGELRGIAEALLEASRGGRVTEAHIMDVSDRLSIAGGDLARAQVTEVGELFMRFEDAQRKDGTPAAAPRGPLDTFLPRRPVVADDLLAPPDPTAPLRPPERPRTENAYALVEPPAITFQKVARPPAEPARAADGTPAPEPRPATPPPAAAPAPPLAPASTRAASAFRCPKCATMVKPGPDGRCPRCGGAPPHALTIPDESRPVPARAATARPSLALVAGFVALGVAGSLAGVRWSKTACDQGRGASVAGEVVDERLGLAIIFPRGWRRVVGAQDSRVLGDGLVVRADGFFRGGTSKDPELALLLMSTSGLPEPLAGRRVVTDAELKPILEAAAEGAARASGGTLELAPDDCAILDLAGRRTGRCVGQTGAATPRQAAVYLLLLDQRIVVAAFFGKGDRAALLEQAEEIVGPLQLAAGAAPAP